METVKTKVMTDEKELITYNQWEGTPFTIIKKDEKWFGVMGNTKVTDEQESEEEVKNWIERNKWLVTLTVILIVNDKQRNTKNMEDSTMAIEE